MDNSNGWISLVYLLILFLLCKLLHIFAVGSEMTVPLCCAGSTE